MDVEYNSRCTGIATPKAINSIVPRIVRLVLAVFIAWVAVIGLCDRLVAARRQAQAGYTTAVAQPMKSSMGALRITGQFGSTRCRRPTLSVTKRIDPADPDTGDVVTITYIITGLGLKPVDAVLVQDVSGSMGEEDTPSGRTRMEVAQATAITFVEGLSNTDRVGVVAFTDTAWLVQPLTLDRDTAIAVINSLPVPDGYTDIGAGIQTGYEELISSTRWSSKTAKAMLLMSDGGASRPNDDPEGHACDRARAAGECGISIYAIGFGQGVNEALMQDIADLSGGEYYFSPDGSELETIYKEIALELRNLVITDVLLPGVYVDCSLWPSGTCSQEDGLTTTITLSPGNEELVSSPLILSFPATVNFDPVYQGPISTDGSVLCYDGPGGRTCHSLGNPMITVGGRKITGVVFEDLDKNGRFDDDEGVLSGVVVTTSTGLRSTTDVSGTYTFCTSDTPMLTVAVKIPPGFISTTNEITRVPPLPGTYRCDFGLYCVESPPVPLLDLAASAQVVRPGTEVVYTYIVSHKSTVVTLTDVVVTDSHLGPISPTRFSVPPGESVTLTAMATLTQNRTSTATVTSDVEGYGWTITGDPAAITVHAIDGISLTQISAEPMPVYHGDFTALHYSVVNQDVDDGVVSGFIRIVDSQSRPLDERHFDLGPGDATSLISSPFAVPRDILVTLTATGWDDIQGVLPVGDYLTLSFCPTDIYEPDDNAGYAYPIYPGQPQLHDFFNPGDGDWVGVRLRRGDRSCYTFTALPLGPNGVSICLTLYYGGTSLIECNLGNPQAPVEIIKTLSCTSGDMCEYFLKIESPSLAHGCWTDYQLSVKETPWDELHRISLPLVLRDSFPVPDPP